MSSALVIGLVAGLAVGGVVVFCCVRNICKEKTAIERQVKQVQQLDEDPYFDDVEAPTPPSEQNTGRETKSTTTTTTTTTAAGKKAEAARAPAPAHDALPSYSDLEGSSAPAVASTPKHVYGDDSEEFQGRHEYQTSGDPYDAPVRVSRSTERRGGIVRQLSPETQSRTSSSSSSRGRSALKGAEAAAMRVS